MVCHSPLQAVMAQPPVTLDEVDTVGNIVQVGRGRRLGTLVSRPSFPLVWEAHIKR